jgi:nucleolar complex protein 2
LATRSPTTAAQWANQDPDAVVDKLLSDLKALVDDKVDPDDSDMEELADALADAEDAENLYISDDEDDDVDAAADDECGDSASDEKDFTDGDDGDEGVDTRGDEDKIGGGAKDVSARQYPNESGSKGSPGLRRGQVKKAGRRPAESNNDGSEDEEEYDDSGTHKRDLEELKTSDPTFYKYLAEHDSNLLDFIEGGEGEVEDDEDDSNDGGDKSDGSAMEEDSDGGDSAAEEAVAAAEAGLDEMDSSSEKDDDGAQEDDRSSPKHTKGSRGRSFVVDMATVRELEQQLTLKRGALKAVKELMRLFRAGRELTPTAQAGAPSKGDKAGRKRQKEQSSGEDWFAGAAGEKRGGEEDSEDDEGRDDNDLFAAGEVKFVSARVYQKVMYLAIVKVQEALDKMLGKPKRSSSTLASRWAPGEHARWKNLEPVFKSYVSQLIAMTAGMQDAHTLRFLLKRMEFLVPYTRGNLRLARRLVKVAVNVWTSDTMDVNEATKLRAYLLLRCIAEEPDNVEIVMRLAVRSFCGSISRACNPRTIPNIMFTAKCIVDLFSVDMAASYTVAFAYLREMAVTLRAVLTSKERNEHAEKVHNWSFVNALRLWSMVLSTYGTEAELRPLIYPFVQIAIGVMRVQPTPRTFPMRLHIVSFLTSVVSATGVYIPVAAQILTLLRCKELYRKPDRGATKDLEWRALLRVNDEAVKTKPYLTGVVNGVMLQLAAFYAAVSRHVSFPEISHGTVITLRKFSKDVKEAEWRQVALSLAEKLRDTAKLVADARARADFGPHGAAGERGMLEIVPGLEDVDKRTPVQKFYDVEATRVKREETLRDEGLARKDAAAKATADNQRGDGGNDSESESSLDANEEMANGLAGGRASRKSGGNSKKASSAELNSATTSKKKRNVELLLRPNRVQDGVGSEGDQDDESDIVDDLILSSDDE